MAPALLQVDEMQSSSSRKREPSQEIDLCSVMCACVSERQGTWRTYSAVTNEAREEVRYNNRYYLYYFFPPPSSTAAIPHANALQYAEPIPTLLHSFINLTEVVHIYIYIYIYIYIISTYKRQLSMRLPLSRLLAMLGNSIIKSSFISQLWPGPYITFFARGATRRKIV